MSNTISHRHPGRCLRELARDRRAFYAVGGRGRTGPLKNPSPAYRPASAPDARTCLGSLDLKIRGLGRKQTRFPQKPSLGESHRANVGPIAVMSAPPISRRWPGKRMARVATLAKPLKCRDT